MLDTQPNLEREWRERVWQVVSNTVDKLVELETENKTLKLAITALLERIERLERESETKRLT